MQNKQIKFQLEHLGLSKIDLSKTDNEEFEILVKVDGGVSERLIVNDGDLCLVCTMEWNIGEFKYYIHLKLFTHYFHKNHLTKLTHQIYLNIIKNCGKQKVVI